MPKAPKTAKEPKEKKNGKTTVGSVKTPIAPTAPPVEGNGSAPVPSPANPHGLPVVHDKLHVVEFSTTAKRGPLTADDARLMMEWETERDYQARMTREKPESKPEHWLYGDVFHCLNTKKEKVRCWLNANNRPFDVGWCEDLMHTVLQGQWAGPLTVPGETINGETVRIGRYGRVLSGQHQLTALILADEELQLSRGAADHNPLTPKYPFWSGHEHPVIETLVVLGLSEDERILRTIDYVKPRTLADMLYTMELFRNNTPIERKDMTRMLAAAIDTLWERTDTKGYRTHPEVVGFLERHRRLLKCVEHLFVENSAKADGGRKISKLRISAGQASALCYLMGSSGSDDEDYGDRYRNECPPSEKNLDWTMWDKSREFWTRLASGRTFLSVRMALSRLFDSAVGNEDNPGLGGRGPEKLAILAKAWDVWRAHPGIGGDDGDAGPPCANNDLAENGRLCLSYSDLDDTGARLPDGQIKLLDVADFGGIDCPDRGGKQTRKSAAAPPMPPPPTREEIEALKEEALKRREEAEIAEKARREELKRKLLAQRAAKNKS